MKHYLVMCKDDQQWIQHQNEIAHKLSGSLISRIELRNDSYIIDYDQVYLKVTPNGLHSNISAAYLMSADKIWLCDKEEFV